jgi:glycosyltransferase involved in cell wall biosynthesis
MQKMVTTVRKIASRFSYEIILVDGGSTDGSLEWMREQSDIHLIEQGELLGAIKAFNAGAWAAQGKYVVFLNDDIRVVPGTIQAAYDYLEEHADVGQVAFENEIIGNADMNRTPISYYAGYMYGQCQMTPKVLGDLAGWWGDEGMKTYGGDTRLSLRLWELGYPTVHVKHCKVQDHVADDELRKINNADKRIGNKHPDTELFKKRWRGRLPQTQYWIPLPRIPIIDLAINGGLRTLRFKGMMSPNDKPRTALVDTFKMYGDARQINKAAIIQKRGVSGYQLAVIEAIEEYEPNMVMFQAQRLNSVMPETVREIRRLWPDLYTINWDGDTHYPLTKFHYEIANAVHLQLIVSPSWFDSYRKNGVRNIGYWPIGVENEYIEVERKKEITGADVLFTGALYGLGKFPEAEFRRDAVVRLASEKSLKFKLHGTGWQQVGIKVTATNEEHMRNAQMHANVKMALSISQSAELWGYTSDRLYNITATGCPAVVQRFPGMEEHGYVDGETCIAFSTFDEMVEKIYYYQQHDEEREQIGRKGREMTLARHTWPHRVRGLLEMLGGLYV